MKYIFVSILFFMSCSNYSNLHKSDLLNHKWVYFNHSNQLADSTQLSIQFLPNDTIKIDLIDLRKIKIKPTSNGFDIYGNEISGNMFGDFTGTYELEKIMVHGLEYFIIKMGIDRYSASFHWGLGEKNSLFLVNIENLPLNLIKNGFYSKKTN